MKLRLLVVLMFTALILVSSVDAGEDINTEELKEAQSALSAGDYEKAFALFGHLAEERNNPLAQFSLGYMNQNGLGRPVDEVAACQWFEKAAYANIPFAVHLFAECMEEGVHHLANPAMAAIWYKKASELGYDLSLCSLAKLYMEGVGVEKDPAKALALCGQAAQKGSPPALVFMGRLYLEGDIRVRDYKAASNWFNEAAKRDVFEAFYYQGYMIDIGILKPQIPNEARLLYEKAASKGYVQAYFATGRLYFNAPIDPKTKALSPHDLAKAYLWLSATVKSSKDKDEVAQAVKMLEQIRKVMPETWVPDLDHKVAHHLEEHKH